MSKIENDLLFGVLSKYSLKLVKGRKQYTDVESRALDGWLQNVYVLKSGGWGVGGIAIIAIETKVYISMVAVKAKVYP